MSVLTRRISDLLAFAAGLLALIAVIISLHPVSMSSSAGSGVTIPAPETARGTLSGTPRPSTETVVLAGGCFWGVQGVYQHVKGVTMAESGYAGGAASTANYDTVSTGTTGHAESVRVTFDPAQVTFAQILQIYFLVVQDPTELNQQGPDSGTQYRSEIFAQNATQAQTANAYIGQLTTRAVYPDPIVTQVEVNTAFYPAEKHHQDFLALNPTYPYIQVNDIPKIQDLQRLFPQLYRDKPVLVFTADY